MGIIKIRSECCKKLTAILITAAMVFTYTVIPVSAETEEEAPAAIEYDNSEELAVMEAEAERLDELTEQHIEESRKLASEITETLQNGAAMISDGEDDEPSGNIDNSNGIVKNDDGFIEISDREGLQKIAAAPDESYILTANIDLSGEQWQPIPAFTGTLDGNGYTISNLKFTDTSSVSNGGLFDVIGDGGTVKNLTISNAVVGAVDENGEFVEMTNEENTSGHLRVGALAAVLEKSGELNNCHIIDSKIVGSVCVGALCGTAKGRVTSCSAERCSISGFYSGENAGSYSDTNFNPNCIGGLAGWIQLDGTVDNSNVSSCSINCQTNYGSAVGGFAGEVLQFDVNNESKIVDCSVDSATEVLANNTLVGGFVGFHSQGRIESSYTEASVKGRMNVGGFVGQIGGGNFVSDPIRAFIDDCSATGNVEAEYSAGGFIGAACNSLITDSSATGNVNVNGISGNSGLSNAGGFAGLVSTGKAGFKNCYATGDVTARKGAGGFVGISMLAYLSYSAEVRKNPNNVEEWGGFSECYASGDVTATDKFGYSAAGGFAGQLQDNSVPMNCYAAGNVTGYKNIGGFVGSVYDCGAVNCYASGTLMCDKADTAGGFAGYISRGDARTVVFTNCVFDKDAAGTDNAIGQKHKSIGASYKAINAEAGWPELNPEVDNIKAASSADMADVNTFTSMDEKYGYVSDYTYNEVSYPWDFGVWSSDGTTAPYLVNLGSGQVAQLEVADGKNVINVGDEATVNLAGYGPGNCSVSWAVDGAAEIQSQDDASVTIKATGSGIAKVSVLLDGVKKKTVTIITGDAGEYGMTASFIVPAIVADGDGMTAYCVDPSAELAVQFSEPADTSTVTAGGSVTLTKKAVAEVNTEFDISFEDNNTLMYVKPKSKMDNGTTYTFSIANSVKAVSGKTLMGSNAVEFKTRSFETPSVEVSLDGATANVNAAYVSDIPHYNSDGDSITASDKAAVYVVARGGKGAREDFGGDILASQTLSLDINNDKTAKNVSAALDLNGASGTVYIDVYTWDESGSYLAAKHVTKKIEL